jgi:hypothetical protein
MQDCTPTALKDLRELMDAHGPLAVISQDGQDLPELPPRPCPRRRQYKPLLFRCSHCTAQGHRPVPLVILYCLMILLTGLAAVLAWLWFAV